MISINSDILDIFIPNKQQHWSFLDFMNLGIQRSKPLSNIYLHSILNMYLFEPHYFEGRPSYFLQVFGCIFNEH